MLICCNATSGIEKDAKMAEDADLVKRSHETMADGEGAGDRKMIPS